jgi:hypothetical protein
MGKFKHIIQIAVIAFLCLKIEISAQTFSAGADTVLKFIPGNGLPHGQNSPNFPKNIFGIPSKTASEFTAETREEEICSLNFGGEIIIGFKNAVIIDAPGPDFTIFENTFKSPIPPHIFAEPAKVAVSRDGITFKEFPFDSLTLQGCAGLTPTFGNKNPFNPAESGGDNFDLADIGMDSIQFIKITDITAELLKPGHPFYQPVLTGFDLDAVVGLHCVLKNSQRAENQIFTVFKNNSNLIVKSEVAETESSCEIFSLLGREVFKTVFKNEFTLPLKTLPIGAYIVVLKNGVQIFNQKMIIE